MTGVLMFVQMVYFSYFICFVFPMRSHEDLLNQFFNVLFKKKYSQDPDYHLRQFVYLLCHTNTLEYGLSIHF